MEPLFLNGQIITLPEFLEVVDLHRPVFLGDDPENRQRIALSLAIVSERAASGEPLYGVTTGVGDSVDQSIFGQNVHQMPRMLARMHGCGLGDEFSPRECRAILFARLIPLARGYSGIRPEVLDRMCIWLNQDTVPRIPQEGSVGASGDLTPLSYIAACLMGEREMWKDGQRVPSRDVWAETDETPFLLGPKETLGIMNGTSAMTGWSCLHLDQAEYLATLACRLTGLGVLALHGNPDHYDERLMELKPHPGQTRAAAEIRTLLPEASSEGTRLQDPYSFRCTPQIIGVFYDALPWMKSQLETELNGVNDNPVLDGPRNEIYHGGHFYGGHMAFLNDSLKNLLANIADLLDRQMAVLVDANRNRGLPANLSGSDEPIYHGLKALQVAQSSYAADAQKLCMPASVFSRSTECHNQDKVSMGLHAARDAAQSLRLLAQVTACQIVCVQQGIGLRKRQQGSEFQSSASAEALIATLSKTSPFFEEDRELEATLRELIQQIETQELRI